MLSRIRSLWRNLLHRGAVERDLDDELTVLHAELTDEKIRAGMAPATARRAATIELGHVHIVKQHVRDARAGAFWDAFVQDARYGARQLRRNPLFAATAMLSLAIGVGANTTIFSLLNALMLRDLRAANPHELVEFWRTTPNGSGTAFSNPMYETLRDESAAFSGVLALSKSTVSAAVNGAEQAPAGRYVSGNFFDVLGVMPQIGRLLSVVDDRPGAAEATVITHGLWERRFGRSPAAFNEAIRVDNVAFRIVGVLPPAFEDPLIGRPADFFIPIASEARLQPESRLRSAASSWLGIVARLKPGTSLDEASVTVAPIFTRFMEDLALAVPDPHGRRRIRSQRLFLESARTGLSDLRRDFSRPVLLLMGAVSLVLLIACVNVVNLLLARGVARRREIALRLAIGASRGRLVRQLLTESTLLGVMGGGVGLAIAAVGAPLLVALVPQGGSPIGLDVTPDARITFVSVSVAVLSSVIAGLFPAFRSARTGMTPSFQCDARSATTRSSARWGRSLIVAQVALSLLLLVGASLLLSTLHNLRAVDPGFDHEHVLLLTLDSAKAGFTTPRLSSYHRQVLDRVRSTPGVRGAALSAISPMSGGGIDLPLGVGGPPSETAPMVYVNRVSDGYFSTLATPVLVGREFLPEDGDAGAATAVVNEALARHYFGSESPVGRRIHMGRGTALEIVGVVADSKYYSLRETGKPTVYLFSIASSEPIGLTLSVRTAGDPHTVSDAIRRDVQSIASTVPVTRVRTLASQVERSFGTERLVARLITTFAVLALVLASVGLYGVLGYSVARRTSEIGVRLALGATRGTVLRSVLRESWTVVFVGSAIGVPAAIVLSRVLAALLYGVSPWDAAVLTGAVASVFVGATVAAILPAWRASRVEPLVALRHE
jgi:predicted permease